MLDVSSETRHRMTVEMQDGQMGYGRWLNAGWKAILDPDSD